MLLIYSSTGTISLYIDIMPYGNRSDVSTPVISPIFLHIVYVRNPALIFPRHGVFFELHNRVLPDGLNPLFIS